MGSNRCTVGLLRLCGPLAHPVARAPSPVARPQPSLPRRPVRPLLLLHGASMGAKRAYAGMWPAPPPSAQISALRAVAAPHRRGAGRADFRSRPRRMGAVSPSRPCAGHESMLMAHAHAMLMGSAFFTFFTLFIHIFLSPSPLYPFSGVYLIGDG